MYIIQKILTIGLGTDYLPWHKLQENEMLQESRWPDLCILLKPFFPTICCSLQFCFCFLTCQAHFCLSHYTSDLHRTLSVSLIITPFYCFHITHAMEVVCSLKHIYFLTSKLHEKKKPTCSSSVTFAALFPACKKNLANGRYLIKFTEQGVEVYFNGRVFTWHAPGPTCDPNHWKTTIYIFFLMVPKCWFTKYFSQSEYMLIIPATQKVEAEELPGLTPT